MSALNARLAQLARLSGPLPDPRLVPPAGATGGLTAFAAGAMALLAVFALALALTTARIASEWRGALAGAATIRVPASAPQGQVAAVLALLETTPGIAKAEVLSDADQAGLLAPWLGTDLPLDALPLPRLIALTATDAGFDAAGLRARLAGEAPGVVLDDHRSWRAPLVTAADRLWLFGLGALGLIAATTAALVTLAAKAALASNRKVIEVLRLVGARDAYIVRAFVLRFALRAFLGALVGTLVGLVALSALPATGGTGINTGLRTELGLAGRDTLLALPIPLLATLLAVAATRHAAYATLRETP